jgi:hypothetical protein
MNRITVEGPIKFQFDGLSLPVEDLSDADALLP